MNAADSVAVTTSVMVTAYQMASMPNTVGRMTISGASRMIPRMPAMIAEIRPLDRDVKSEDA